MREGDHYWSALRHPFDIFADVPDQGWLARLVRRPDTRAATAVLERTLARLAPRMPSAADVAGIYRHFRIPPRRARPISIMLWARMLRHCEQHDAASDDERNYLDALLVALGLQECDVEGVRKDETSFALLLACRERMFNSAATQLAEGSAGAAVLDDRGSERARIAHPVTVGPQRRC